MGKGTDGVGDFGEPAFSQGARSHLEPPLRVGTWTDFFDDEPEGGGKNDGGSSGLGPERMVEAAVPRARGARRLLPGDHGDEAAEHASVAWQSRGTMPACETAVVPGVTGDTAAEADRRAPFDDGYAPEPARAVASDRRANDTPDNGRWDAEESAAHTNPGVYPDGAEWFGPASDAVREHPHAVAPITTGQLPSPTAVDAYSYDHPGVLAESADSCGTIHQAEHQRELADDADRHVAGPDGPECGDAAEVRGVRSPFETVVLCCAPAVALVALLYYFGRARSVAMADYLGFDDGVLGYTTKEYLLRSVDILHRPLLAVVAVLLAVRILHPTLVARLRRHRRTAWCVTWGLRCAWFAVPAAAWTAAFRWPGHSGQWWPLLLPGALTVGVLASAYGVVVSRRSAAHQHVTGMAVRPFSLSVVLTASAVALSLFWTLGAYAEAEGRATALRMVGELPSRTGVVVLSKADLRVAAEQGVTVETLSAGDSPYKYRYAGLRLLRQAGGRVYLLPDRWSWERPRLIVVREDTGIRVDYLRAR